MINLIIKFTLFLFLIAFSAQAQTCDCLANFNWVKNTFEQNDAGFEYSLKAKGNQAYEYHNNAILERVKSAKTLTECTPVLYEWLTFFRSGHISIRLDEKFQNTNSVQNTTTSFPDWETLKVDLKKFEKELNQKKEPDYEGIWETPPYKIGIKKVGAQFIGFIIESGAETWTKEQVKLKIAPSNNGYNTVYYMRDHSAVESEYIELIGKNELKIGNFTLKRVYPEYTEEKKFQDFTKLVEASKPYLEKRSATTLYFRIPSFQSESKRYIDSVILANKELILKTENLIIDIRGGTGGSDSSYKELIQFLYTNPIRTIGVEYLSTELNNQRMLDFINKPEYGFSDEDKVWAQNAYDKLKNHLGEFISLNPYPVSETRLETIHPFPKNVGIIINKGNGSTDEQFLLEAKQSKKVKLFGKTTQGVLDISNMYFIDSPCQEFKLGYSLSRSMRIPDFTIDEIGIQPDYYLDKDIPEYEWVDFVEGILTSK